MKALIIGIGNEFRSDDAAGLIAARRLKLLNTPGFEVAESTGESADMIELWKGRKNVILVDAVMSGSPAGTVHFFPLKGALPLPKDFGFSSHLLSLADAIRLSEVMGWLPENLVFYGVEGKSFGYGTNLSPEVEEGIKRVVDTLIS
jgi:hydrogenase maturation protease